MYAILTFVGMVLFIASFFIKDKDDKIVISITSMVFAFVISVSSVFVTHVLQDGTVNYIGQPYAMGIMFFFLAMVQIFRLYHWNLNGMPV